MLKSIKSRLITAFIGLALGPLLFLGIVLTIQTYSIQKNQVMAIQNETVKRISSELELFINRLENELNLVIKIRGLPGLTKEDLRKLLSEILAYENYFEEIILLDNSGMEYIRIHKYNIFLESDLELRSDEEFFQFPRMEKETYFGPVRFIIETGEPLMQIAIPIENPTSGSFFGVLMVEARFKAIWQILAGIPLNVGENIFITDSYNRVIAHPNPSVVLRNTTYVTRENHSDIIKGLDGEPAIMAENTVRFGDQQFRVIAQRSVKSAYAVANQTVILISILIFTTLIIAISLILFVLNLILKPIKNLAEVAKEIKKGDLTRKAAIIRNDEVGDLSSAFNQMTDHLTKTMHDLEDEIHERKSIEQKSVLLRNLLKNIINSMPSIMIGVDREGHVTQWNDMAVKETGISVSNAIGQKVSRICPFMFSRMEIVFAAIEKKELQIEKKVKSRFSSGFKISNLAIYPIVANGIEGAVIRIDDVTEQSRLEEMMIQNEKILSVGGLAAGMAHEINNPLAGMIQTANVLSNRLGEKITIPSSLKAAENAGISINGIQEFIEARDIPRMISSINESGRRIAGIVENMLSFSHKNNSKTTSYNIEELIDKTIKLAETDYNLKKKYDFKMINIIREYEKDLPLLICDRSQIQQVVLNILQNGAQAMQEAGTKEPQFIIGVSNKINEKMIRIAIKDNGPGMDEKIRKRIFEPFFTTKPAGIGTGLGLSVSYFIITENHNGKMAVESIPGKGSTFIIHLPLRIN